MHTYAEQRARLARMIRARDESRRHIEVIRRQIENRAERMTITTRLKTCQYGRMKSTRTRADERDFQANAARICFERRNEIDALSRKLERQEGAIAAFCVRHRLNTDAICWTASEELAS